MIFQFYFSKTPVHTHSHNTAGENMETDYITKMIDEINRLCVCVCVHVHQWGQLQNNNFSLVFK